MKKKLFMLGLIVLVLGIMPYVLEASGIMEFAIYNFSRTAGAKVGDTLKYDSILVFKQEGITSKTQKSIIFIEITDVVLDTIVYYNWIESFDSGGTLERQYINNVAEPIGIAMNSGPCFIGIDLQIGDLIIKSEEMGFFGYIDSEITKTYLGVSQTILYCTTQFAVIQGEESYDYTMELWYEKSTGFLYEYLTVIDIISSSGSGTMEIKYVVKEVNFPVVYNTWWVNIRHNATRDYGIGFICSSEYFSVPCDTLYNLTLTTQLDSISLLCAEPRYSTEGTVYDLQGEKYRSITLDMNGQTIDFTFILAELVAEITFNKPKIADLNFGESITYDILITNTETSFINTYWLSVTNSAGLVVVLDKNAITLAGGESEYFTLTITALVGITPIQGDVTLTVIDDFWDLEATETIIVNIGAETIISQDYFATWKQYSPLLLIVGLIILVVSL